MMLRVIFRVSAIIVSMFAISGCKRFEHTPQTSGTMPHDAYVWQRDWNPPVKNAIETARTDIHEFVPLAGEIVWKNNEPSLIRVPIDFDFLRDAKIRFGLALRINAYSGTFSENDRAAKFICETAKMAVSEARQHGVSPEEIQIDFDCAQSKLAGYAIWIRSLKKTLAPIPVTITALPSWLKMKDFPALAQAVDSYVLQVHSYEAPRENGDRAISLCDPVAARRAVERAGRIDVPFRVALPTYRYIVAFDSHGKTVGIFAEGMPRQWPSTLHLRLAESNAQSIAMLVSEWTASRPKSMLGVIWYRLPISSDTQNWRWQTLDAIIHGKTPKSALRVKITDSEPAEIALVNEGEGDAEMPVSVTAQWQNGTLEAGDAIHGFRLSQTANRATFSANDQLRLSRLSPGEKVTIGWLRFQTKTPVYVSFDVP